MAYDDPAAMMERLISVEFGVTGEEIRQPDFQTRSDIRETELGDVEIAIEKPTPDSEPIFRLGYNPPFDPSDSIGTTDYYDFPTGTFSRWQSSREIQRIPDRQEVEHRQHTPDDLVMVGLLFGAYQRAKEGKGE